MKDILKVVVVNIICVIVTYCILITPGFAMPIYENKNLERLTFTVSCYKIKVKDKDYICISTKPDVLNAAKHFQPGNLGNVGASK